MNNTPYRNTSYTYDARAVRKKIEDHSLWAIAFTTLAALAIMSTAQYNTTATLATICGNLVVMSAVGIRWWLLARWDRLTQEPNPW